MKEPLYAKVLIGVNQYYPIAKIHFETRQVTVKERENVFNTVSLKDVEFDYSGFSEEEKKRFNSYFH